MADHPQALEQYLKKLMEIQYNASPDTHYSEEELKNIALEAGLTEEAWQQAQRKAQTHLGMGKAHADAGNWEDATTELEAAAMLMPHHAEANFLAAKAFFHRGQMLHQPQDYHKTDYYLDRTLLISPQYHEAYALKTELNNRKRLNSQSSAQQVKSKNIVKWLVMGGVVLLLVFGYFSMYNGMVEAEENTTQAWAQVENVYQRRADLVPNLVETVRGAAEFERSTLNEVVEARAAATAVDVDPASLNAEALREFARRQDALSSSLGRLLAISENYPTLRATENFRDLQAQLEGTENRIAVERRRFNEAVQQYNAKARRFPYNLLGFEPKAYFSATPESQQVPDVSF